MHKILIVDDEKPARDFIAELVTSYLPDSKITKTDHPLKAMECLKEEDFDLLFLDICMPGMTGLDLLEKLSLQGKHIYTVLVSAYREFDYAVKGIELGVVQYLTKPLYREKIHETIRSYLKYANRDTIVLNTPQGAHRLSIEHILAIQTVDRAKVKIYTPHGEIPFATGTLSKFHLLLPAHFHYIRRDCILNFHAIAGYNLKGYEVVILCRNEKTTLKISREKMKELAAWLKL